MRPIDADALPVRTTRMQYVLYTAVLAAPTLDVEPVRHGEWLEVRLTRRTTEYKCSECGHWEKKKYPYCNCGAKMDGRRGP